MSSLSQDLKELTKATISLNKTQWTIQQLILEFNYIVTMKQ